MKMKRTSGKSVKSPRRTRPGFYGKKVHLEHFALYTLFADYGAIQKFGDAYKLKKHAVLDAKNRADLMAFAHQKEEGFVVCRVRIDEVFRIYRKGGKYAKKHMNRRMGK